MKRIPNRIMESVDDGFQLCADTIEIDWRSNDKHICLVHFFIDEGHVILLGTRVAFAHKACVTSQAWIHFVITHRDDLHMMMLCCSFGKSFSQQFCIATLTRASGKNQYVHRGSDNGNTYYFRYSFNVVPAGVRNAAFNKEGFFLMDYHLFVT